ncbi:Hypp5127 [Branchiostoma lanceolatum]|uniref:Hypp5127 protein n=1 Tax=Branchiostoma lanceolatum TaxID=7740 RepID=A0A8K0ADN1_BRALA|nr:Hypp5127 [Branchiostoma lanceolatum]
MKYLAVLLCMSGMAAICLGQGTTVDATTADATTADATTVDTTDATTVSVPATAAPAVSGASATGTGPTDAAATQAGGGGAGGSTVAPGTTAAPVSCLNCTGNDTDASDVCGGGVSTIIGGRVTCAACWVYRDESTASGEITITRGCALEASHTCDEENKSEQCDTANGITRCRQCCTEDECNDELLGNGAADVHVSIVVTVASALFAILALWQ